MCYGNRLQLFYTICYRYSSDVTIDHYIFKKTQIQTEYRLGYVFVNSILIFKQCLNFTVSGIALRTKSSTSKIHVILMILFGYKSVHLEVNALD